VAKNVKVSPKQSAEAVSRALASRGGSAFRITSGQRKAIIKATKESASNGQAAKRSGSDDS
jgi:hypothetical protein